MATRDQAARPRANRGDRCLHRLAIALALLPFTGAVADEPAPAIGGDVGVESDVKTVEAIAKRVRDSIVTIRFSGRGGGDQGLGTGFVIAADGFIATNYHVIGEARPVSVELSDGSRHDVTAIHASDRAADLAIVRIAKQGLLPLSLGAPETLLDGAEVVAAAYCRVARRTCRLQPQTKRVRGVE